MLAWVVDVALDPCQHPSTEWTGDGYVHDTVRVRLQDALHRLRQFSDKGLQALARSQYRSRTAWEDRSHCIRLLASSHAAAARSLASVQPCDTPCLPEMSLSRSGALSASTRTCIVGLALGPDGAQRVI